MKLAVFLAIASSLIIAGGLYKAYTSTEQPNQKIPTPVYDSWQHWKKENGKSYGTNTEEDYRLQMFASNYEYIAKETKPEHTFEMALNQFADMELEEFVATFTGIMVPADLESKATVEELPEPLTGSSKDWVGVATTPVKNQGACGSCWAFSTTGGIEGAYAVKNGTIKSFSEQQLVDCSKANHGCHGGMMMGAFDYVREKGILEESQYTYTAREGFCQYDYKVTDKDSLQHVTGYTMVPSGNQNQLAAAIQKQPVSVAIMATRGVQMYTGGIFNDWSCGGGINHGVLAVGYADNYFKVKNSWGPTWGESGFIRFARRASGQGICSITMIAVYPQV